ncbi:secreted protein [gut metagenome]|uniref:Secreted protein n=1 Tax=gut metagenome TaxID=749906 RepID=J9C607_9ZZZZ
MPYQQLLFSSFFLISNGFLSALTSTSIVLCALSSNRKTDTMTNTTVTTNIH